MPRKKKTAKEKVKKVRTKKKTEEKKEKAEEKPKAGEEIKEIEKEEEKAEEKKKSESEETAEEKEKEEKLKKLKARAEKLAEGIEEKELKKEDIEIIKGKKETLLPLEEYVKAGIHLGTRVITPTMRQYVYRRRADGLAVLNTNLIDDKLKEAIKWLNQFKPEQIFVACKREAGWKAAKLFSELTGIRTFTKKYPAGIITNIQLPGFFEVEAIMVCDPWVDKNALNDGVKVNCRIMGLCDTNNNTRGIEQVVPCNNKASKSLGLIFYLLAKNYLTYWKINKKVPELEKWTGE